MDPQREDQRTPNGTGTFQNYIERNDAELKRIQAIMHMATSSAPDINMVIKETRRTTFTNRIASVRLHDLGKIKFPSILETQTLKLMCEPSDWQYRERTRTMTKKKLVTVISLLKILPDPP